MGPKQTNRRIDQTLTHVLKMPVDVLGGAVEALLRRPTPLHERELLQVAEEFSLILLRIEEAFARGQNEPVDKLLQLVELTCANAEPAVGRIVALLVQSRDVQSRVSDVMHQLAASATTLPHLLERYLTVVDFLSAVADGKDVLGSLLMDSLIELFQRCIESDPEGEGFQLQRVVATILINLVSGSKSNKERPKTWRPVVTQLLLSNDVFHQMQCIELLFRVTRQPKRGKLQDHPLLTSRDFAGPHGLPTHLATMIASLPTDSTLMQGMLKVCEAVREEQSSRLPANKTQQVFSASVVSFGGETIATKSQVFFCPYYFIVMIRQEDADNVTVPYNALRSVKMTRDGSINLRLASTPSSLSALLTDAPDGGIMSVAVTTSDLVRFKSGPIQAWVLSALERSRSAGSGKRERVEEVQPQHASGTGQLLQPAELFPSPQAADAPSTDAGTSPSVFASSPIVEKIARSVVSHEEVELVMSKVQAFMEQSIQKRQLEAQSVLEDAMNTIQDSVDAVRKSINEEVDELDEQLQVAVKTLSTSSDALQNTLSESVASQSNLLEGAKETLDTAMEAVNCADLALHNFLENDRASEQQFLREIKRTFDERVEQLEHAMHERMLQRSENLVGDLVKFQRVIDQ